MLSLAMISSMINRPQRIVIILTTFESIDRGVLRIYKPNIIICFEPLLTMIGRIFSERWANNNYQVKILYSFSINSKTRCVFPQFVWPVQIAVCGVFYILCHLFDAPDAAISQKHIDSLLTYFHLPTWAMESYRMKSD